MGNTCRATGCREDAGGGIYCPYCSSITYDRTPGPLVVHCGWCEEEVSIKRTVRPPKNYPQERERGVQICRDCSRMAKEGAE
jgi:hypothetical protein